MARTKADLEQLVIVLNNNTGQSYELEHWNGYALCNADGQAVSPRLDKRALYWWISAYLDGWQAGQRHYARPTVTERNAHLCTSITEKGNQA